MKFKKNKTPQKRGGWGWAKILSWVKQKTKQKIPQQSVFHNGPYFVPERIWDALVTKNAWVLYTLLSSTLKNLVPKHANRIWVEMYLLAGMSVSVCCVGILFSTLNHFVWLCPCLSSLTICASHLVSPWLAFISNILTQTMQQLALMSSPDTSLLSRQEARVKVISSTCQASVSSSLIVHLLYVSVEVWSSKNVQFLGHNHLLTILLMTLYFNYYANMDSMVVSWWIVFFCAVYRCVKWIWVDVWS